jgi:hypothetical protein
MKFETTQTAMKDVVYEGTSYLLLCECGRGLGKIDVQVTDPGLAIIDLALQVYCPSCGRIVHMDQQFTSDGNPLR